MTQEPTTPGKPGPGGPQPSRIDAAGASPPDAYRGLFERSTDPMTMIVGERFIDCNEAVVKMLGVKNREEVLRMHPSQISPPTQPDGRDSFEKANDMIAIALDCGSCRFEWDHRRVDGTSFPVEVLLTVLEVEGQQVLHAVWRDLAEQKALEDQLRHALKMEAIGKLAGGVAHDFNNLLVVVQGHADLLGRRLIGDRASLDHLEHIKEAGHRAAALVQQLLAFGRKQEILPQVLDLNAVVMGSTSLLKPLLSDNVELEVRTADAPVLVKADHGQLEQVLMNLAANARDAMPNGGQLTIAIETRQLTKRSIASPEPLEPGPYGIITITDTGAGMSKDTVKKAFDPFFTTKGIGQGTGLGLATVYGIVTQNGGGISLRSTQGQGTTVEIQLPVSTEALPVPSVPVVELPDPGGAETILVVEDEPVVSELIVQVLKAHGYSVLLAGDGAEALDTFRRHRDTVALVLTDVMMPRLSGIDLVKTLSAEGFRPAVLFMSGYTNNALPQLARVEGHIDLIKKPFDLNELARRVRGAIDRTTSQDGNPHRSD